MQAVSLDFCNKKTWNNNYKSEKIYIQKYE